MNDDRSNKGYSILGRIVLAQLDYVKISKVKQKTVKIIKGVPGINGRIRPTMPRTKLTVPTARSKTFLISFNILLVQLLVFSRRF